MTDYLAHAYVLLLAWIFVSAGVHKLTHVSGYNALIVTWQIVPASLVRWLVIPLALLELALGVLVFSGWRPPVTGSLAAALLAGYAAAMTVTLRRGLHAVDCGCGGLARRHRVSAWTVLRNLLLAVLCVWWSTHAPQPGWLDPSSAWWRSLLPGLILIGFWHMAGHLLAGMADPDDN